MKKVYGIIALISLFGLVSCGEKVAETVEEATDTATNVVENVADTATDVVEEGTNVVEETTDSLADDLPTEEEETETVLESQ